MPEKPWYQEGLKFRCTACGNCCTGAPGYVWVNRAEIERLADALGLDDKTFRARCIRDVGIRKSLTERPGGDCVLFDNATRRCRVYDVRPRQCRTWPFWRSNLRNPQTWAQTCETCPGSGSGDLVPVEEIERQLAILRL